MSLSIIKSKKGVATIAILLLLVPAMLVVALGTRVPRSTTLQPPPPVSRLPLPEKDIRNLRMTDPMRTFLEKKIARELESGELSLKLKSGTPTSGPRIDPRILKWAELWEECAAKFYAKHPNAYEYLSYWDPKLKMWRLKGTVEQYVFDADNDKLDDRLRLLLEGVYDISHFMHLGDKVRVVIYFDHYPTLQDKITLRSLGVRIRYEYIMWDAFEAWVPVRNLKLVAQLPGVQFVQARLHVGIAKFMNHTAYMFCRIPYVWYDFETNGSKLVNGLPLIMGISGTGVDPSHPDIASYFYPGGYDPANDMAYAYETDPDTGQPYYKRRFLAWADLTTDSTEASDAWPNLQHPSDTDWGGHGTACAAIWGGAGIVSKGYYRGLCPGCRMVAIQVFDNKSDYCAMPQEAYDQFVKWKVQNGIDIKVVSMSWGIWYAKGSIVSITPNNGASSDSLAVNNAAHNGILPCISAGNSGDQNDPMVEISVLTTTYTIYGITIPADAARAVTVGAVMGSNPCMRWPLSSNGPTTAYESYGIPPRSNDDPEAWAKPDIMAPSEGVVSCNASLIPYPGALATGKFPIYERKYDSDAGKWVLSSFSYAYQTFGGTSGASPVVAGVAGLMYTQTPRPYNSTGGTGEGSTIEDDFKWLSPRLAKIILLGTAQDMDKVGWDRWTGHGLLDAYKAVVAAKLWPYEKASELAAAYNNVYDTGDRYSYIKAVKAVWSTASKYLKFGELRDGQRANYTLTVGAGEQCKICLWMHSHNLGERNDLDMFLYKKTAEGWKLVAWSLRSDLADIQSDWSKQNLQTSWAFRGEGTNMEVLNFTNEDTSAVTYMLQIRCYATGPGNVLYALNSTHALTLHDSTPPTFVEVVPGDGSTVNTFSGDAPSGFAVVVRDYGDPASGVKNVTITFQDTGRTYCMIRSAVMEGSTWYFPLPQWWNETSGGTKTITFKAYDWAGNVATKQITITFNWHGHVYSGWEHARFMVPGIGEEDDVLDYDETQDKYVPGDDREWIFIFPIYINNFGQTFDVVLDFTVHYYDYGGGKNPDGESVDEGWERLVVICEFLDVASGRAMYVGEDWWDDDDGSGGNVWRTHHLRLSISSNNVGMWDGGPDTNEDGDSWPDYWDFGALNCTAPGKYYLLLYMYTIDYTNEKVFYKEDVMYTKNLKIEVHGALTDCFPYYLLVSTRNFDIYWWLNTTMEYEANDESSYAVGLGLLYGMPYYFNYSEDFRNDAAEAGITVDPGYACVDENGDPVVFRERDWYPLQMEAAAWFNISYYDTDERPNKWWYGADYEHYLRLTGTGKTIVTDPHNLTESFFTYASLPTVGEWCYGLWPQVIRYGLTNYDRLGSGHTLSENITQARQTLRTKYTPYLANFSYGFYITAWDEDDDGDYDRPVPILIGRSYEGEVRFEGKKLVSLYGVAPHLVPMTCGSWRKEEVYTVDTDGYLREHNPAIINVSMAIMAVINNGTRWMQLFVGLPVALCDPVVVFPKHLIGPKTINAKGIKAEVTIGKFVVVAPWEESVALKKVFLLSYLQERVIATTRNAPLPSRPPY